MNGNRSIKMRMEWVFQEWFVKDDNEDDMKRVGDNEYDDDESEDYMKRGCGGVGNRLALSRGDGPQTG